MQALHPLPADATGLGTASQQQAAELQRLLEARGAKLPSLTSSPEVGLQPGGTPCRAQTLAAVVPAH
jgi:hypothetical protein